MTPQELIEKSKEQRSRSRFEEALISARAAVNLDPSDSEAWWQAALSYLACGDKVNAIPALQKVVEISPDASNAWARLGELLLDEEGDLDEAKTAFRAALAEDPGQKTALVGLSRIFGQENDPEQDEEEEGVLSRIEKEIELNPYQINRLGIVHYRNGRFHEAIRYWKMDVEYADVSQRFNLGLAYNSEIVSQDADAIDMWRMALRERPDYAPPKQSIERLLPRLLRLASIVRSPERTFIPADQWFENYINPYELLNVTDADEAEGLSAKEIQRLKKTVLQEIELEEGQLSWMPHAVIHKSRAIECLDTLDRDESVWHLEVFKNKPLLRFLTRGSLDHFLVDPHHSSLETIDQCEQSDGFLEWLSPYFAKQYDRVLAKAIEDSDIYAVECLLDGRLWVMQSAIDECFLSARRIVDKLMQPLEGLAESARERKTTVSEVEAILHGRQFVAILNKLPMYFEAVQNTAVHLIRDIAIASYNQHDDAELSKQIIDFAKQFKFKSAQANATIQEDIKTIDEIVTKERQNEAHLTSGSQTWDITAKGVSGGGQFIPVDKISSFRAGSVLKLVNNRQTLEFLVSFTSSEAQAVKMHWTASVDRQEEQQKHFQTLINATLSFVAPGLLTRMMSDLENGRTLFIGPCKLRASGIEYPVKGWVFSHDHSLPWHRVETSFRNGVITVSDKANTKEQTSFDVQETDNAMMLQFLALRKNKEL